MAALIAVLSTGLLFADSDLFIPGGEGDGPSIDAAISADGRYIAFASEAANLVSDDLNEMQDIFVRDRQTGDTERVSLGIGGEEADGYSEKPVISADGRLIAFQSTATNLVPFDNNGEPDVFVYDRQSAATERVSVASDGSQAAGSSFQPGISADGRWVVFASSAINLDPRDTTSWIDVFIHDRQTGQTELISLSEDGAESAGFAAAPAISADGRYVAFSSAASNLVAGDGNDFEDIFLYDRQTGDMSRVSVRSNGDEVYADSYEPALSADGRYVVFWSYAVDLTEDEGTSGWNVYLHDQLSGETTLISKGTGGDPADNGSAHPRLSGDGRFVVFDSEATNLTAAPDDNAPTDVFIHDRQTNQTSRLSVGAAGPGDNESLRPALTPDGRIVAFQSLATNLVGDDGNGASDIFIRDRQTEITTRVSLAADAPAPVDAEVYLGFVVR